MPVTVYHPVMPLVGNHRRTMTAASLPAVRSRDGHINPPKPFSADNSRLWSYYRTLGVVHYGMQFKRDAALRARFLPAVTTGAGNDPTPLDPDNPQHRAVLEVFSILDAGRGRIAEAVGDLIVHLDVAGIGWPVYQQRGDEDRLSVFGTEEIDRKSGRLRAVKDDVWTIGADDLVGTVWRPSPEDRSQPDSPLRSVADDCEQLIAAMAMVRAAAQSRIPAGILVASDELELPPGPNTPEGSSPFATDMITALTAPIQDRGSAASVAPWLVMGPTDAIAATRHIDLGRPIHAEDLELISQLKRGVATGLDLPTELIVGVGDLNHWSTWYVDASAYSQHLDPNIIVALDGLTRQVFHLLIVRLLGWPLEEAERFVIWRDISGLHTSPNRVADAVALFDRGVISAAAVRRVAGYDDTDAPGGDEVPGPTPQLEEPVRQVEGPPEPSGPIVAAAAGTILASGLADIDAGLLARLSEMSRQAIRRATDRAGARARNRLRSHPDLNLAVDGVANRDVCRRLGRPVVTERLAVAESELITRDDFADLGDDAYRLLDRAVNAAADEAARLGGVVGRDEQEESEAVHRASDLLVDAALAATVARLFTGTPQPDPAETGEVGDPASLDSATLVDVMTVAGGGVPGSVLAGALFVAGVGNGLRASGWLRAGGLVPVGWKWDYGDRAARAVNFEPHLSLDGVTFERWDDQKLAVHGGFPRAAHYRPQDHKGCLCTVVQELWTAAEGLAA